MMIIINLKVDLMKVAFNLVEYSMRKGDDRINKS